MAATAACSAPADRAAPAPSTATAPTAPIGPNDVGAELPTPSAYPTDDAASRATAQDAAAEAMAVFLRVDLSAAEWLAGLSAHLTADAAGAFYGTDPLEVPARAITGQPRWDGSTSGYLAEVVVPTDVGDYRLLLVREGQGAPWLVQTITPPDGVA
jgi:hypothetical protein